MPSPRAVLADLKKLKLDTKKAWSAVGVNGHLKGSHSHAVSDAAPLVEKVVAKEIFAPEPVILPVVDESPVVQEDAPALEPQPAQEILEDAQDTSADSENDFFRSKKKKKLTT